ncbi:O-antigen ligase family protein, partial [Klebsiella sp. K794]
ILILTETRSALIVYPVILLYILFNKYAVAKWKALSICALSFILFSLMIGVFSPNVYKRASEIITDITLYQQNNNTSIGARLTMWYSGINEIITHPGGVSAKERYQILADFINKKENGNPEALRNIPYHLHNDLIETMSLQGAASGLFLFFFYITLIYYMTRKKPSYAALFLCLPVLFFGTVDSLFIHVRFVIMLIGWLIIYTGLTGALLVEDTPYPPPKKGNEAE